jgi:cysteine desulfurase
MSQPAGIYLDYAATTPVDDRVIAAMQDVLGREGHYGNPSSSHAWGHAAAGAVARARAQVAEAVGADVRDILFTSGATESDNLAIRGVLRYYRARGAHLVTARTEHKAVLDTCADLAKRGCEVTYLDCDGHGLVSAEVLAAALRDDTVLVSLMHVNNETGVVQDIDALGRVCHERGVFFHVDAAQSVGKLALDLRGLPVDLVSLTAHKAYGPKGIGALYRHPDVMLSPLQTGGDQEAGVRPGTLPTHQIVGMGAAFEFAGAAPERQRVELLRQRLSDALAGIPGVQHNGHPTQRVAHILNVSFPGVEGESLRLALESVAVSAGSACTSAAPGGSHVLRALGLDENLAQSTLRFSLGRYTTAAEIDAAAARVTAAVQRLRAIAAGSPPWTHLGQQSA